MLPRCCVCCEKMRWRWCGRGERKLCEDSKLLASAVCFAFSIFLCVRISGEHGIEKSVDGLKLLSRIESWAKLYYVRLSLRADGGVWGEVCWLNWFSLLALAMEQASSSCWRSLLPCFCALLSHIHCLFSNTKCFTILDSHQGEQRRHRHGFIAEIFCLLFHFRPLPHSRLSLSSELSPRLRVLGELVESSPISLHH